MSPPSERRATLLALALIAVAALLLHREVLFGGAVYHMDDAADGYYPSHVAIARAYREGSLPAWERGAATGWPLVADPYYGPFYPLGAIFGIVGAAKGLGVQIALHTILCAAGMLLLLRRRGRSPYAAAFGAASLALSTFVVCRVRHIIFPEGLAWMTFALAGAEGYLRTGARRDLVLVAAAVGLTLLCGALPLLPFFGLFAVCYVTPGLLRARRPVVDAAALGGAALLGLALAAAQLVPTLSHLPLSPRALGTSFEFASSYAWPKLVYLATLVVPDLFGGEVRARWFGAFNHWEMAAYYTGVWALLFALLAYVRAGRSARIETTILWAGAILGILLAFGERTPVHGWFYRHVPLYAALRCPTRALTITMLAWSVLGADGLDVVVDRLASARRRSAWLAVATAIFVAGIGIAAVLMWTRLGYGEQGPIPGGVVEGRRAFAHLAWVLGLGGFALALLRSGRALGAVRPIFLFVAIADLFTLGRGYVQPVPADYVEGTDRFQAVRWLLDQKPTDRFTSDAHGPFRLHNVGMTYGVESAAAYSSVQIFRYVNFLEVLATGRGLPTPLRIDPAASDVRRFDTPLVDLLNVRWVIADHMPAPGYVERFHPRMGASSAAAVHEPLWDARLSVWENPHVLPRAFVVHAAKIVVGDPAELAAVATLDPRRTVLVDRDPGLALPEEADGVVEPARLVEAGRDRLVIEAVATKPGILVVSEAHYPGWSAFVDGVRTELLRADYAFRGVALAPGHHRVVLLYRPIGLYLGLAVSAGALLALLVLLLLYRDGVATRARSASAPVLP